MDENRTGMPPNMEIDVKIYPMQQAAGNVLASASVTLNGCFAVKGLRVMNGSKGPFVSMPSSAQAPHPSLSGVARKLTRSAAPPFHSKPASLGFAVVSL